MMRSLYAGISGLRNHQTRMDVIGNNIANVNTVGFKGSRVSFQDMLSQTLQGAAGASGNKGGTNPVQIGMGMGVASIDTIFTDGSFQSTGKQTDLAIAGQGFFILTDGTNQVYTRAGSFDFDTAGNYLVPGTGYKVMGYKADINGVIDSSQPLQSINIPVGSSMAAKISSEITYENNLKSAAIAMGTAGQKASAAAALASATTADAAAAAALDLATTADTNAGTVLIAATAADADKGSLLDAATAAEMNALKNISTNTIANANATTAKNTATLSLNAANAAITTANASATASPLTAALASAAQAKAADALTAAAAALAVATPATLTALTQANNDAITAKSAADTAVATLNLQNVTAANMAAITAQLSASLAATTATNAQTITAAVLKASVTAQTTTAASVAESLKTVIPGSAAILAAKAAESAPGATGASVAAAVHALAIAPGATPKDIAADAAAAAWLTANPGDTAANVATAVSTSVALPVGGPDEAVVNAVALAVAAVGATGASVAAAIKGAAPGSAADIAAATAVAASTSARLATASAAKVVTATALIAPTTTKATTAAALVAATTTKATTSAALTKANVTVAAANDKTSDALASIDVFDSQGNAYTLSGTFEKTADNTWSFTPKTTITNKEGVTTANVTVSAPIIVEFNTNGTFKQSTTAAKITVNPTTVVPPSPYAGAGAFTVTPNFSTMTQYGNATTAAAKAQDGYSSGFLTKTSTNTSGIIVGQFDNGQILNLAQVALANFNNPSGLGKAGESLFVKTTNSGEPQVGAAGTGGRGNFNSGSLEMSNVDLAQQFSDMIVTQRGFQANSKIITTTDTMLEELVNLKR